MKAGIVGFEGAGKRTLFTLLTRVAGAASGRAEQIGVLKVPDEKVFELTRLHRSRKSTLATVEFVLIPSVAFQETRGVLLDDVSGADLSRHLGVPVAAPPASARGLLDALGGRGPTGAA